jgi:hypothetical protein
MTMAHHHFRKPPEHHFANLKSRAPILVEHNGAEVSLTELSRLTGIGYHRLWRRYEQGKRGAELIEPAPVFGGGADHVKALL